MSESEDDKFPALLYENRKCTWCFGSGEVACDDRGYRHRPCEWCGGSGRVLTTLGEAFWNMARKAAEHERKEWIENQRG